MKVHPDLCANLASERTGNEVGLVRNLAQLYRQEGLPAPSPVLPVQMVCDQQRDALENRGRTCCQVRHGKEGERRIDSQATPADNSTHKKSLSYLL